MPAREDVFRVADEMRAEAIRISIRTVRKRLPNGGSYRSIGEHLADWKVDRCYQPVLEASQIPEALQRQLAALGKTLWDEVIEGSRTATHLNWRKQIDAPAPSRPTSQRHRWR